ncbi:MAG: DegT/DnrJ/EryC1/StrS aminotransferase family protein [Nitrospira sp.]|nr:DegT/DnrJ/EryC1/StrS aminotransferase family protein [Nitrospira sp.]
MTGCLANGDLVNRHQLKDFEQHLAEFVGVKCARRRQQRLSCAAVRLLGAGVGPGHEVITVAHAFVATVSAIVHCGGAPGC